MVTAKFGQFSVTSRKVVRELQVAMHQVLALDSFRSIEAKEGFIAADAQCYGSMGLAVPDMPDVLGCAVERPVVGVGVPEVRIFLE